MNLEKIFFNCIPNLEFEQNYKKNLNTVSAIGNSHTLYLSRVIIDSNASIRALIFHMLIVNQFTNDELFVGTNCTSLRIVMGVYKIKRIKYERRCFYFIIIVDYQQFATQHNLIIKDLRL